MRVVYEDGPVMCSAWDGDVLVLSRAGTPPAGSLQEVG
jgi:hypothetical protein